MSLIKVTSEELVSTAAQLTAWSQEIDSQLASMHSAVQALVDADWQGAASASFQALYQEWNTSAANLQQALEGIAKQLSSAGAAYAETEEHIQQTMR